MIQFVHLTVNFFYFLSLIISYLFSIHFGKQFFHPIIHDFQIFWQRNEILVELSLISFHQSICLHNVAVIIWMIIGPSRPS
jgi:hypothetical protein